MRIATVIRDSFEIIVARASDEIVCDEIWARTQGNILQVSLSDVSGRP